ncbi:MAG: iron-containing alcohol dehydrogenase [Butyricicoccus sp.]|nr:iron-containing alcohol dehydrogenase [Butyricicoccus sp.]
MKNFTNYAPNKVVFGRDVESGIGAELKALGAKRVLVHFGGGSCVKSGLLGKVTDSLKSAGLEWVELGGVGANPRLDMVRKGTELARAEGIDFVLAIGGGSVIDSSKAIAVAVAGGGDFWEYIEGKPVETCLPLGVVLTIAAAGSEMSDSCVITDNENHLKRSIGTDMVRPKVAFMNPENTFSVSPWQTACGAVDIMMHTMERYFTGDGNTEITDRMAEGVLLAVLDAAPRALADPCDYDARATLMWASSLSHNGLTGCGRSRYFPAHKLEHDFSGLDERISHGAGLAVLFPAWAKYVYKYDVSRFAQFAVRVMGCQMDFVDPARTALEGIEKLIAFFRSLGMPTTLPELGVDPADYEKVIALTTRGGNRLKGYVELGPEEIREIYALAE